MSFPDFLVALRKTSCEIKVGKQVSVKPPGSKKFFRFDILGEDYSETAFKERLAGERTIVRRVTDAERKALDYAASQKRPNLLIDIQAKIQEGIGDAYVQWMKVFNLQTASRTLLFLKEHNIDSYDELREKSSAASGEFHRLSGGIKVILNSRNRCSKMSTNP